LGCCAQRCFLAWPEEKADHARPPQATALVPLAHRGTASPSQARRPTRPQAAGVVLPVPTGGFVLVHGCGVGSLRRARPLEWLRRWRSSVAGVVCEPAWALRRTHVAGGVSPSVRARARRGRAAPHPAPWAWRRVVPGVGACCGVRWLGPGQQAAPCVRHAREAACGRAVVPGTAVPHTLHPGPWRVSAAIAHGLPEVAASGGQSGGGVGGGGQSPGSLGPRVDPQHPNQGVQATVDSLRSSVAPATHRA